MRKIISRRGVLGTRTGPTRKLDIMFTKSLDEITFKDVETFCQELPEGVRVEYKQEIKDIPKIVSSFANTLGGIYIIGAITNKKDNRVTSIPGIPKKGGIEEQIQQSAVMGIYPAVIPEIKIVGVPNSGNVVVIVRVDESLQAPHAIEGSTKVYFRPGSITQPYKYGLADMDRINYMLKRREDSQIVYQQILNRFEEKSKRFLDTMEPNLTVIARPAFPYRPIISALEIYELHKSQAPRPRKVAGGVSYMQEINRYFELNEYGISYHRAILYESDDGRGIDYGRFLWHIDELIDLSKELYEKGKYSGNIEVTAQLRQVYSKRLYDSVPIRGREITDYTEPDGPVCSDSEVSVQTQCMPRDFENRENRLCIVEELTCQLLWAFNIALDNPRIRGQVRQRIEQNCR